jgi:ribosome-binding factor A
MSRRTERLGSTIQRELAAVIQRELHDPRLMGMTSITRVKVSEDLSFADVFVTIMGTPGQQTATLNALKHSAGMMRTRLVKALAIRQTPYLRFQVDEDLKKELDLLNLLDQVSKENAELERKRAEAAAATAAGDPNAAPQQAEKSNDDPT